MHDARAAALNESTAIFESAIEWLRHNYADLVIVGPDGTVEVAAEFMFEPSHRRSDILPGKLPVVFWGKDGVAKEVERIQEFIAQGKTRVGYSIFIDEGGHFPDREPHPGTVWLDWGDMGDPRFDVSALWSKMANDAVTVCPGSAPS